MQIWKLEDLRNPKQSLSLQHVFLRGINEIPPDHYVSQQRLPDTIKVENFRIGSCMCLESISKESLVVPSRAFL